MNFSFSDVLKSFSLSRILNESFTLDPESKIVLSCHRSAVSTFTCLTLLV